MPAGWSKWTTHTNQKQYRALCDGQGAVLCLQWNDEDGPYTDERARARINKQTVEAYEAGLNLLDTTPRSRSTTQLELSAVRSSQRQRANTEFEFKGSNPTSGGSLSTLGVDQPEPTSDSHAVEEQSDLHAVEEQSESPNDEIPGRVLQDNNDVAPIFRELVATEGLTRNEDYQIRHANFFVRGRVFRTHWSEPRGVTDKQSNDEVYQTLRPMVVIRQLCAHCLCLPVYSNNRQGVAKTGLKETEIEHHAILYMSNTKPQLTRAERGMHPQPNMQAAFPVKAALNSTLDRASRLRFDMVYTVRYNLRVRDLGRVEQNHLARLDECWRKAMGGLQVPAKRSAADYVT